MISYLELDEAVLKYNFKTEASESKEDWMTNSMPSGLDLGHRC